MSWEAAQEMAKRQKKKNPKNKQTNKKTKMKVAVWFLQVKILLYLGSMNLWGLCFIVAQFFRGFNVHGGEMSLKRA